MGNPLQAAVESGEPVIGARTRTFSSTVIEVYGELGLDFVWLDFEHAGPSPYDSQLLEDLARAAETGDVELLVRLPGGDPGLIRKVLDAGMRNVIIPRVETAAEVERSVKAGRFRYDGGAGERGFAAGKPAKWGMDTDGYASREDESVSVGVIVENATALDNLEAILSVPELGFAFVGHQDLSVSLGYPQQPDHPDVQSAIETIRDACLERGVPLGGSVSDVDAANERLSEGYSFVRIGDELEATRKTLSRRLDELDVSD
jgi:2-keto-3-deoxy-L-rhamnonate aldolase RhmA